MAFDAKKMLKRELNVSLSEQKIRYYVGGGVLLVSVFMGSVLLLLAGVALVVSGYTRWCPLYSALGKNSADEPSAAKSQPAKPKAATPAAKPKAAAAPAVAKPKPAAAKPAAEKKPSAPRAKKT